ncbi:hypothetical protein LOD99_8558 [Oopsacas minuta]|uniref:Transposase n=1 Tax=Oopsacas minuta TaxID=111878 RepID=A0AAV7JFU7_9METZ|nr:hypothetical protein LOD99_8558 [Oopsacas minuta]
MVKEYSIMIRSQAVGMLQAGSSQKFVSLKLGVNIRTVQRWWRLFKNDLTIENKGGRGRKKSYKRPRQPLITEKNMAARLKFCKERVNWTANDWKTYYLQMNHRLS